MKYLSNELNSLLEATLNNLKSSKSNNTLRAYKSDFKDFELFCKKYNLKSLPTEPKIVSLYITHLAKDKKVSTLKRRLVAISMMHKLKSYYLDIKHPIIIENLLGIKRAKGSIQIGKKPILVDHIKLLINKIDQQKVHEKQKLRDKTILLLGFGGGFRRTELISINYEDIEFVTEGLKIMITRSKTDQYGEGMIKGLPYFTNEIYCPVVNLKKWLQISQINSGAIFRRFIKGSALSEKRLTSQSVALIIKKYLNLLGIDSKNFAGHSLRSGFATVASHFGADERSIMAMTGHKSPQMVRRYIREANVFKNNALSKIKI